MTEKIASHPGMKLAKIGGIVIGATLLLVIALALLDTGFGGPLLFFFFFVGFTIGGALVVLGFLKRIFAALEKR